MPTFSEYISRVGPPGALKDFWTGAKVKQVVDGLKKGEPFSLGWLDWKKQRDLPIADGARDASDMVPRKGGKVGGDHGYSLLRQRYVESFEGEDAQSDYKSPSAVDLICNVRGWKPEIITSLMEEGVLGIQWSDVYKGDVKMSFAYRGFYTSDNSYPVRIIKTKHLMNKLEMSFKYAGEPTPVIADFSSPNTSVQEAQQVLFCEGEPDGISWRHLFPDDGIVCLGNQQQYSVLPELLPRLRLNGKDIIYAIDRDVNKDTGAPLAMEDHMSSHVRVLDAIRAEKPKSLSVWMCPLLPNRPVKDSKDINDFLKVCQDGSRFLMAAYPLPLDEKAPIHSSYKKAVEAAFARKAFAKT